MVAVIRSAMILRPIGGVPSPPPTKPAGEFRREEDSEDFQALEAEFLGEEVEDEDHEEDNGRLFPTDFGYKPENDCSALVIRTQESLLGLQLLVDNASSDVAVLKDVFGISPRAVFNSKLSFQLALAEFGYFYQKVSHLFRCCG